MTFQTKKGRDFHLGRCRVPSSCYRVCSFYITVCRDFPAFRQGPLPVSLPPLMEKTWQDAAGSLYQRHQRGLKLDDPTLMSTQPPQRPGFGSIGENCLLRANRFLTKASDQDLHHYNVIITPETALKKFSGDTLTALVRNYGSKLGNRMLAFDGRKNMYTAGALPFETSQVFLVKLKNSRGLHLWEGLSFPKTWTMVRLGKELSFVEVTIRVFGRHRWVLPQHRDSIGEHIDQTKSR